MNNEKKRLEEHYRGGKKWLKFGPYVSDRQWGTVREDYSENGTAWDYLTHEMARSKAYRWGEDGIGGISDNNQYVNFALALWNGKDAIIKERYFGLNGNEGNHGEDVKELYYYLDSTPTHSYMKMLYKYPQNAFPYQHLITENQKRDKLQGEFELIDTGIFNQNEYFDVFIEYAKADNSDILIKITVYNRSDKDAQLHILPTLWYRNTWAWGYDDYRGNFSNINSQTIAINHKKFANYKFHCQDDFPALYCDNETNTLKLYNWQAENSDKLFYKDGINDYLVNNDKAAINPKNNGSKVAINAKVRVAANDNIVLRYRLENHNNNQPFADFDEIFQLRKNEADEFYRDIQKNIKDQEDCAIQRQAYAGMLWSKQYFYYDVKQWLNGDPAQPSPPPLRKKGRNREWAHLNNADIISMPDKWEYPWYAAWDLAFHCIPLARLDCEFAKAQLLLFTKEWYMHSNGQLPAYEWQFGDVNPPVHAWATWEVYSYEKNKNGIGDRSFLEAVFHKLLLNFTWWVNRKDEGGNNIFQGGFLGLDNIGVFDRSAPLPTGGHIEQADGTSWMAMYSLNMMRIALELAIDNKVYENLATKFFEHFLYIAEAMANLGDKLNGLWDDEDKFFYDSLRCELGSTLTLKIRSLVGLTPLFANEILSKELLEKLPSFVLRLKWFLRYHPHLCSLVSRFEDKGIADNSMISLLRGHRMKKIINRLLDESEFLGDYGIRALSKFHEKNPYILMLGENEYRVDYTPGESTTGLFGGNSNWRGPIWFPMNYMLIQSLKKYYDYYGADFKVEYPHNSKNMLNLQEVACEISKRLINIYKVDKNGNKPLYPKNKILQKNPHFKDYYLFYEYFHGDNGRGIGASHQTGWSGLVATLIDDIYQN